jgi:uncharacterized protein
LKLLQAYLPEQIGAAELDALIELAIASTGAASIKDMGKVMAVLKERFAGQMDFSKASAATKDALSGK